MLYYEQFFLTTLIRLGTEPVEPGVQGVHPQPQYLADTYSNQGRSGGIQLFYLCTNPQFVRPSAGASLYVIRILVVRLG